MSQKTDVLKYRIKEVLTPIFIISALITTFFSVLSLVSPEKLSNLMTKIQTIFATQYGWVAMLIPVFCMGVLLFLSFSKYGNIIIGGKDAKPQYSTFSWISMLFTSSIGIGIIYFGVNEPLYAYFLSPACTQAPNEMIRAAEAMGTSLYHWGVSVWAIFSVAGLYMGYFVYRHNIRFLPGDILEATFPSKKWSGPLKNFINIIACVCSAMTISATMGLGSVQVTTGMVQIFNLPLSLSKILPYIVLAILLIICLLASTTKKIGRGMNIIGDWNSYLAIGLLLFGILFGPTRYILNQVVQILGTFASQLVPRNFEMFLFSEDPTYSITWDIVNNMWWIAWTPFMGVFIASISKGRSIRQFSLLTMTIPVIFMIFWHCTFGGVALLDTILGTGEIGKNALTHPDLTFFILLQKMPLQQITTIVTVVLLIMFISTTVTSAALSLGRMTDKDGKHATPIRCAVWCILMASIALTGIFSTTLGGNEGLNAIKSLATTLAYPYLFFFILLTTSFLKKIIEDEKYTHNLKDIKSKI